MASAVTLSLACGFGIFLAGTFAQYPSGGYGGANGGYSDSAGAGYGASGGGAAYGGGGSYGASSGGSYGSGSGGSYGGGTGYGYNQGTGVYFKKPVPIDEKPIFFRTPYWLPNMYYGHYGYPWTEWFDGGPRYVIPIMNAYPHGGGGTQSYGSGYADSYSGGMAANGTSYSGGSAIDSVTTTTADPYNDGFSYYKGIPMYQTYYEKYLLQKAQAAAATTAAPVVG